MAFIFYKRKKFWKRLLFLSIILPVFLFFAVVTIVYFKQDSIVSHMIKTANADFTGMIKIKGSHVSPFATFPNISIDIEGLQIFEGKKDIKNEQIVYIKDSYIGFNIWDLIAGKYDINSIRISDGRLSIVQHKDGSFNISNAFKSKIPIENVEEEFNLDLKSISMDRINLSKLNEENNVLVKTFVSKAKSKFKTSSKILTLDLNSNFELSVLKNNKKTFIEKKHFKVDTEIEINKVTKILTVSPTELNLENSTFGFQGKIHLNKDADLDLQFKGNKPNFDLILALAPSELQSTLKKFENNGQIYFNIHVLGKSANGHKPAINGIFGCKNGQFNNLESKKKLSKIGFKGTFTNGKKHDLETMKFVLEEFSAKPEAGIFSGKLTVENFKSPNIDMKLISDFDLDFLAKFFNTQELKGLSGGVKLTMNFKDIIDLKNPEKSIERLNESYYTELEINNLKFKTSELDIPINNLNLKASLTGHQAKIEKFDIVIGKSDLHINGSINDLPALIHHTNIPISSDLKIKSKFIDLAELTKQKDGKIGLNEQINNLSLKLKFLGTAKSIAESPTLPIGEFFIEDLYAKMKYYPHTLHDFHADVLIDKKDFKIVDFVGMIDKSDFNFTGKLGNYDIWFNEEMKGDTKIEFDLKSNLLQFDNTFRYGGENFVPEEYRHEEIRQLKIHGFADLHFKKELRSTDLYLTSLEGKMKVHPLKLEKFKGRIHLENKQLTVNNFGGKIGKTQFELDMDYFLGKENKTKKNKISIHAPNLNFDELMNYNPPPKTAKITNAVNHDKVFSIFDFDIPEINIQINVGHLNYHKYILNQFSLDLESEKNHIFKINKLTFEAVGGSFDLQGYLSGKDKKHIYLNPILTIKNIDLDKFLIKFDNFGQDHIVSENLHGKFSGKITGKIHLHADLVPKIDDSEIKMEMTVVNGRLENFAPIIALSNYFQDKNLSKIMFDTLDNVFTLKKSVFEIPKMTVNSTLGFMEITGKQRIEGNMEMDYLIGIPWKMIGQVASKKLFKRKENTTSENEDEVQYRQKNSKFVFIKLSGDLENYKIGLAKKVK